MHGLRTFFQLAWMSIRGRAQYPWAMVLGLVTSTMMFAAEFTLIYGLALQVGDIKGWQPPELAIMYVATMLAGSLEVALTDSLRSFADEIISGNLDTKLLRPVHPLVLMVSRVSVDAISIPIFSAGVLALTVRQTAEYWNLPTILWFISFVLGGALIFGSLTVFSSALAFWTHDSDSFYRLTKQGTRQVLWYPLDIYGHGVRVVLTFVLPLAFVGYFPAHAVLNKVPTMIPMWMVYLPTPIGLLCMGAALTIWHLGLSRYESVGG